MESQRRLLSGVFVVWPSDEQIQLDRYRSQGFELSEVAGLPGAYLARAQMADSSENDLKKLRELFGSDARILNVLEDESGGMLIPTGNISVVLKQEETRQEIDHWASNRHLKVVSQSKWRPKALVLAADQLDSAELGKTVEALEEDPRVDVVEQQVYSKFKRE